MVRASADPIGSADALTAMASKKTILQRMKENPKNDWGVEDVGKLCAFAGLSFEPPSRGSHYKVVSQHLTEIQTIPAHRPIKAFYIKALVRFAERHMAIEASAREGDE